jgi:group I intron endonuclease
MNIYSVYRITNKINNKVYIGYTSLPVEKRFSNHWKDANNNSKSILHKSMLKHGIDSFVIECLYQSKDKTHIKSEMENYFILEYNSFFKYENGYNMTLGGDGGNTSLSPNYINGMKQRDNSYQQNRGPVSNLGKSNMSKAKKGKRPPNFETWSKSSLGKSWYHCKETEECKRFFSGEEPNGWIKGALHISQSNCRNPRNPTPVYCLELNKTFDTVKEAAEFVGLKCPRDIIDSIIGRNQRKSAAGYHWEFA